MPQPDGIIYGDINGDNGRRVDKIFLKQWYRANMGCMWMDNSFF
jgi:hypothetical protein